MRGGSGFHLLGMCAGGAALLLAILYLLHGEGLVAGGIIAGATLFGATWRWVGRRFRDHF